MCDFKYQKQHLSSFTSLRCYVRVEEPDADQDQAES